MQLEAYSCRTQLLARPIGERSPLLLEELPPCHFWKGRVSLNVPRGPFKSSREWLDNRLHLLIQSCEAFLLNPDEDEYDKKFKGKRLTTLNRLCKVLPSIFLSESEVFALHHDDLSRSNILISQTGFLGAIVDWECTGMMPSYVCCQFSGFLRRRDREEKPDISSYSNAGDEDSPYHQDLEEYDFTLLRKEFETFMESKYPDRAKEFRSNKLKAEFDDMVTDCDDIYGVDHVDEWLDGIEKNQLDVAVDFESGLDCRLDEGLQKG